MDLELTGDSLETAVSSVATTDEGKKFIAHLISISGAFSRGCNGNSKDIYNKGKADLGMEIVELMELYADSSWIEIIESDIKKKKENKNG